MTNAKLPLSVGTAVTLALLSGCTVNVNTSSGSDFSPEKQDFRSCEVYMDAYGLGTIQGGPNDQQLAQMDVWSQEIAEFDTSLSLRIGRFIPWWKEVLIADKNGEEWPPSVVDDLQIFNECAVILGLE